MSHPPVTTATLEAFSAAWNRHDLDALMGFMSEDCVFMTAGGPDACGARHVGHEAVRQAFAQGWATLPDAQWRNGVHFVHGDFGVSQWTYTGTAADGSRVEARSSVARALLAEGALGQALEVGAQPGGAHDQILAVRSSFPFPSTRRP